MGSLCHVYWVIFVGSRLVGWVWCVGFGWSSFGGLVSSVGFTMLEMLCLISLLGSAFMGKCHEIGFAG